MKNTKILILALLIIICSPALPQNPISIGQVQTSEGLISGTLSADKAVKIFMGVPFAAPPVGNLRWKAPQPVKPWKGIKACVNPPASAMQTEPAPFYCWTEEFLAPKKPISEDCLYLNVWTMAKTAKDKKPVIVWIHGGGFNGGSGTVPLYNGEEMAKKGVVFVTINYRLGIFGFLAHPALSAETPDNISGNYGILDQIAALKWVKKNIAAFGGDSSNVTIAGQSAGSYSVNILMISPYAKGLFQRAIAQSGGSFKKTPNPEQSLKSSEAAGLQLTQKLGIQNIDQLRAIPADSILKIQGHWSITVDHVIIPESYATFAAGKQNDVPLLTGWNGDDGTSFGPAPSVGKFREMAQKRYGEKAAEYLRLFPANNDEEAKASQKLNIQLSYGWSNYQWALLQSKTGKSKAYLYRFTHVPPGEPNYGAFHSSEFGYALKTLRLWNRPFKSWDYKLSDMMSSYWVNFAKTGNPNGKGLPVWPQMDAKNERIINFGDEVTIISLPNKEQMSFMDEVN